ncbi:MAG: acetyl-CoA carboxylase, carboxyltransferase subunit beta [Fimbriimonadaceae bacterium]|nr:acetyl-CoA carboxylase, carboxyltransferase subunit beta [Fimbriimonadaceae bacterium]
MRPGDGASGVFCQCAECKKILLAGELFEALGVCPNCGHHHRLSAARRIEVTFDPGSFEELDADLRSIDPIEFPEYSEKLRKAEAKTGSRDGVVSGVAALDEIPVSVAVTDFDFMGGSLGSVAAEKIVRTFERGLERKTPVIVFSASGGARMQEGLFSLMQIAKTTAAVQRCRDQAIPYISVFTDPTMAGVLASHASIADVILSEPKALVGFAGARVSKQAQVSKVPDNFQTAEFVFEHGMIDRIVPRKEMRPTLIRLVRALGGHLRG